MSRRRRRRKDALGGVLIALGAATLMALAFAGVMFRPAPTDPDTLCRLDRAVTQHTIILVDDTDRLEPRHRRRLEAVVAQERARLAPEQRLTILAINARRAQEPRRLFSLCLPRDGTQTSPWFENPARAQALWDERVGAALRSALRRTGGARAQNASPILASLRAAAAEPGFEPSLAQRRIVVASDLFEHQPNGFSLYDRAADFAAWRAQGGAPADLSGVDVRLSPLDRPEHGVEQTRIIETFWRLYFEAAGARTIHIDPFA